MNQDLWRSRVAAALKDAAFDDRLVTRLEDGITVQPLYQAANGPAARRPTHGPWGIFQRIDHPAAFAALAQAKDDLANGTTGLVIVGQQSATARGFGLTPESAAGVLSELPVHEFALRLEGGMELAAACARAIAKLPVDPARLRVAFGLREASLVKALTADGYVGPYMEADGRLFHEQGMSDATELGATLAAAATQLRLLENIDVIDLGGSVGITLAATQDMFLTLAKFRAMRILWARLIELCKLPSTPLALHGESSWRMLASLDPHTNLLRNVAAVFGAGLGGASSVCVLPMSLAQGLPNGFARRMARNTHLILQQESHLWRVDDPAAGAGYVEALTQSLCERAWDVFRNCERGIAPGIDTPSSRVVPVIGTSQFLLAQEHAPETVALS